MLPSSLRKFPVGLSRTRVVKYVHLKCATNCATASPSPSISSVEFCDDERRIFSRIEILILLLFCSIFQCKRCLEHQFLRRVEVTGVFACRLKLLTIFASETWATEQNSPCGKTTESELYESVRRAEFGRSGTQRIRSHCGK